MTDKDNKTETSSSIDPELLITQMRRIKEHPCYDEKACHLYGRMHLPVAPKCNMQCNYCIRDFDCVNESRPGVCSKLITPKMAVEYVRDAIKKFPYIKVIGIAGPGEPLYNNETFETLKLIKENFPHLLKCLSSNGLLLPEKVDLLNELDVGNITVTINAVDPKIGAKIYSFINYHDEIFTGEEGAKILLDNQLEGIKKAIELKMIIKVNTVYIPGINDDHIIDIAKKARELGVYLQNIIPLIPQYKFANLRSPTVKEIRKKQAELDGIIKQMKHCRQCRADAIGKLGCDVQEQVYE
ncbi:MAG: radical SAM protein [Candidatus Methanoliparum thermophilum]|uniref:FeMo cofactor biosynthesis protein NifB n=1 Tax=Methanoliparum thermophilum TaxID=2491083 RepID=A0A520KRS3_METT2|nr:radical SAM protein [Candidatus Methanoliparum sp. LAM-1]RZN63849.1 MAG: radical SAM protein [Candidatus Methanoliparum thermophilum]BDC36426.1 nitrogenase cofactor biosynthesis protein NifB [Candidatus Methanoliparum sp. LAM-1]